MAPAPKQKIAPEGCILSEDGKKVHCTLCTSISPGKVWFAWASLSNHLKSAGHARAENQHKTRQIQAAAIERDRQNELARRREAEMQFSALRDVQIPEEVRTSRVQTTMETELWNQLEEDPHAAGFDLGIDSTTQQYNELCSEMNSLWNAGTIGYNASFSLGEGNEEAEDLIEDDNDDEFLAEIPATVRYGS
ncbi:hypothetical protein B0H14DRAFT_3525097 [Mycena olivaceomarginata]|nr:hypothetical protein B0H14DRAFT_3525097 [Mycena olivaceomarginata]